jgi:hypothetical protein
MSAVLERTDALQVAREVLQIESGGDSARG